MVCLSILDIKKFKEGVDKNNKSYEMYDVSVQQEDTKAQYKATLFVYRGSPVPKVGTQIEADIVKKDKYTNINKWREMDTKDKVEVFKGTRVLPQTPQVIHKEPDWDAKELRDFRSRALAQVSSSLKPHDSEDDAVWADRVIFIAENKFRRYVYEGYSEIENGKI